MLERKTNYGREENMVDVLDNCDDPVIQISNGNEASVIPTMLVTIYLLSIFTLTSHHHHLITAHSIMIVF